MSRRGTVGLVVVCAVGLIVGYGAAFNGSAAYPDTAAIDAAYPAHVGDRVSVWATVVSTADPGVVIDAGSLRLTTTQPIPATVGDRVQMYGELRPDRRIVPIATNTVTSRSRWYQYGVSLLGGLVAAGGFLRRWRIDTDRWVFVPRGDDGG